MASKPSIPASDVHQDEIESSLRRTNACLPSVAMETVSRALEQAFAPGPIDGVVSTSKTRNPGSE